MVDSGNDHVVQGQAPRWNGRQSVYALRLYIAGSSIHSRLAVANLTRLCSNYLPGRYTLDIVDVYQQPGRSFADQIVAAPTLIRLAPHPAVRIIGDLSNTAEVLRALNIDAMQHGESDGTA